MFIITSAKKGISAISRANDSVEFHNKLFKTDDCVVAFQKDPTEAEVAAMREQEALSMKSPVDEIAILKQRIAELEAKVVTVETKQVATDTKVATLEAAKEEEVKP